MAKPMMLQDADDKIITSLKKNLRLKTKIEVIRQALKLLKERDAREKRIVRWRKAARLAAASSYEVLREFQPHSRLKKNE